MSKKRLRGSAENANTFRFVVQEHSSRTHHFDLRLEKEGVFKSWAVPKGVPMKSGVKRLAVQVEDHALEWGEFEGKIPEGEYGAGTVNIWDKGTHEVLEWKPYRLGLVLNGEKLQGRYEMIRYQRAGEREWLIFKVSD